MFEETKNVKIKFGRETFFTDSGSGVLYILDGKSNELQFAISPWHKGLKIHKKVGFDWIAYPGHMIFDLITFSKLENCKHETGKFLKFVPGDIVSFVRRFPYNQLALLRVLKISELARELRSTSPVLFWKLVDHLCRKSDSIEEIRKLDGGKRLDVIKLIYGEFPKSELISMDRFLRRVKLCQRRFVSPMNMIPVDAGVRSSECRQALSAMKEIPVILLGCLFANPEYLSCPVIFRFPIIEKLKKSGIEALEYELRTNYEIYQDALGTAHLLEVPHARRALNQCKSVQELGNLHDEWVGKLNAKTSDHSATPFPDPPLPCIPGIEPIKNATELSMEGRLMNHCVSTYHLSIYAGRKYVYRVLRPERGTLMLQNIGNYWDIKEFKLAYNEEPSETSWDHVRNWFNEAITARAAK